MAFSSSLFFVESALAVSAGVERNVKFVGKSRVRLYLGLYIFWVVVVETIVENATADKNDETDNYENFCA